MSNTEVKIYNWFKYSVLFTCAPFLFALLISVLNGYPKTVLEIFPDLILTVFSVGVNAVSYISDLEKQTNAPKRIVYVKDVCEVGLVFFLVLYFGIFNFDFAQNLIFKNEDNVNQALAIIYKITWGVGIVYALSVVAIEIIIKIKEKLNNGNEIKTTSD